MELDGAPGRRCVILQPFCTGAGPPDGTTRAPVHSVSVGIAWVAFCRGGVFCYGPQALAGYDCRGAI